jgi:hypothetical protein
MGYADMYIPAENSTYDTQNVSGITISGNLFQASGPDQGSLFVWAGGSTQSISGVSASGNQLVSGQLIAEGRL